MALHRLSLEQGMSLWTDLVTAYYGLNGFGGDTAEIYVYRCMPHSPAFALGQSKDMLAQHDIANANETLGTLLCMFAAQWDARIRVRIGDEWVAPDPGAMRHSGEGHRWYVRVEKPSAVDRDELDDAEAFTQMRTYMRAFASSASGSPDDPWHQMARTHADPKIRAAWEEGTDHGRTAHAQAASHAWRRFDDAP